MKIKLIVILLTIISISFCNDKNDTPKILWDVQYEGTLSGYHILSMCFQTNRDTTITLDFKAFMPLCYYDEEIEVKKQTIEGIIDKTKFSQVIVENKNSKLRLLSEFMILNTDKPRIIASFDCSGEDISKTIKLGKRKIHRDTLSFDYKDYFQTTKHDKQIRFHYFFKPNLSQEKKGLKKQRITSNWFNIYD